MPKYLFIGGESDGLKVDLPGKMSHIERMGRKNAVGVTTELYLREEIRVNDTHFVFYRHDKLSTEEAIGKLFANYVPLR